MLLRKTLNLSDVQLKADESGRFSGYASVFGGVDSYGDTIVRGAFAETLEKNGPPKMFFNHNWDSLPIGKWTAAKEDEHGLFVEGELTKGVTLASDVRASMLHGTLDGLSIGGYVKKGDYEESESGRVIRKWSTLVEVSPVVFPADSAARIEAVKHSADMTEAIEDCKTLREVEALLRDAAGFSRKASEALLAHVKRLTIQGDPGESDDEAFAKLMQALTRIAQT